MISVSLQGQLDDVHAVIDVAHKVQRAYRFATGEAVGAVPVRFSDREGGVAVSFRRARGVVVSTWQSEGISAYVRLARAQYLLTLSVLGVIQWRALALNALLTPEDFLHRRPCGCLFERKLLIEESALLFERPRVCQNCLQFYSFLCPGDEIRALRDVVESICTSVEGTTGPNAACRD